MRTKIICFLTLLCAVFPATLPAKSDICVTVIVSGSEFRSFWSDVIDGATIAGIELGIDIHARGTVNDMDTQGQKFLLHRTMKKYQCQGIVIAPSDKSRNSDITEYMLAGIPTVYIDRDTGGDRIAVVQTDNFEAGKLAARKMAEALGDQDHKVVLFRVQKGIASTDLREAGFIEEAESLGLDIISDAYLGARVGDARWKAIEILAKTEQINGIFTPNDTTTIGVLKAIELNKKHKNVIHIGFDESDYIKQSLKSGKLYGYVVQQPFEIGYLGVHAVHQAILGETPLQDSNPPVLFIKK